ncbi:MAG TPA: hypothetical protein DCL77_01720 [Prolixibacteraceae bacterium]|jgi:hypothetical protein|nr:hypothetical protein [Prolixibacteraceae bacterium]
MFVDVKMSKWQRLHLPREATKDEVIGILKGGDVQKLWNHYRGILREALPEPEEYLSPNENWNQETIELHGTGNQGIIWTNKPADDPLLDDSGEYPKQMSIVWSVDDFEQRAIVHEGYMSPAFYDRNKFSIALHEMCKDHDATIGITWDTIDYYLDKHCNPRK